MYTLITLLLLVLPSPHDMIGHATGPMMSLDQLDMIGRLQTIPEYKNILSTRKGVIRVKTNRGCGPCQRLKADVKDYDGLIFEFIEVPLDQPLPALEWHTQARGLNTLEGWPGLLQFINIYNDSRYPLRQGQIMRRQADISQAPTPIAEVRRVLDLLRPMSHETFVDYGCGDGRWLIEAAKTYHCRAIGVEIDPEQVVKANQAIADAGLSDRIQVIEGDVLTVNVDAQVGVAYLYPDLLMQLKPKLLKLGRFATYMHQVDGVAMVQSGDAWIGGKQVQIQTPVVQSQRYAWYDGQAYSGRVCNNPRCAMCNAIQRQLGF